MDMAVRRSLIDVHASFGHDVSDDIRPTDALHCVHVVDDVHIVARPPTNGTSRKQVVPEH
jgi:hypothetical protein